MARSVRAKSLNPTSKALRELSASKKANPDSDQAGKPIVPATTADALQRFGQGVELADQDWLSHYPRMTSFLNRITYNPNQCGGRPCLRGMRIRVKDILEMLADGASEKDILESYPYLEREDIQASLQYAAAQADHAVLSLAK